MTPIPVFYRMEQNAFQLVSPSPSAAKPAYVVKSWMEKFKDKIDVRSFAPVKPAEFRRVHDFDFVYRILTCKTENGFGTKDENVARTLPFTTGSMAAAAYHAYHHGGVAVSPTSGFHHAGYARAEGFCTFNGLMVAATQFVLKGEPTVGILDCDEHYGNGTDDIINRLGYRAEILNFTRHPGAAPEFTAYMNSIHDTLTLWKAKGVRVVLYQAGADPHVNDPYGGSYTSEELRARDTLVFGTCHDLKLPIAWNLAGGYQTDKAADPDDFTALIRPVLDLHDATMDECIKVYGEGL